MSILKIIRIVSATHGGAIVGIKMAEIERDVGDLSPNIEDGALYASGADLLGSGDRFPVTANLTLENLEDPPSLVSAAFGDLVIVGRLSSGSTHTVTVANFKFKTTKASLKKQADGQNAIGGFAFSDDGDTIPVSVL